MENFDQIFILLAKHDGISLNTDILETGLINIVALVAILVYTGQDFLGSSLKERRTTIIKSIQDAESRLYQAQKRLDEAKKQLSQVNIVIRDIKKEALETKKILLEAEASQAKKELTIRFDRAFSTFRSKNRQIFLEIKNQIITLVLKKTVTRIKEVFKSEERANAFMNETIDKLEGDLL